MQTIINIVVTILVFSLLILSHEAGHFFMALWAKIKVHEFSIGMGPALYKHQFKKCLFCVRAFPIGGFVQMEGEDGGSDDDNSFAKKPKWKRFLVLVMGATMNIVMGFILICCINATMDAFPTPTIGEFESDAVSSSEGGLEVGDEIVSIDGYRIYSYYDFSYALSRDSEAESFDIAVNRDGERLDLKNVKFPKVVPENGISYHDLDFRVYGEERSIGSILEYSAGFTVSISRSIYSFIGSLFTFDADLNQVSGPVGTATAIGESATLGLDSLLLVVALISINLGIMNLLPFPALDGGRILLLIVEAIRRKPLSPKVETAINGIGLMILMALMLLVTFKDIIGLF